MVDNLRFSAPCLFGLEGPLADEIKKIGATDVEASDGRVMFSGDMPILARANLWLRTAERVGIVMGGFKADSFDALYEGVRALPWERFIGKNDTFPVSGWSLKSRLFSIPDCQSIIKKAVVDRLSSKYGILRFEESGPVHAIKFSIMKDEAVFTIDTSGKGLHKRGYRQNSNDAPLKETLAAGMVALSRPYSDSTIYDPFCGSGTIAIEAALALSNTAPGLKRAFSAEKWEVIDREIWKNERTRALDMIDNNATFRVYASDIDEKCCELTRKNASYASVGSRISVERADISDFVLRSQRAIVITNPPYGERMLDIKRAREIYKTASEVFPAGYGLKYNIISSDDEFERFFGRRADRKRKLYNGMLRCRLYMYFKGPSDGK